MIDYNNLTEEQLNSWQKDRIDQELIDRFTEMYKNNKHNKSYLREFFKISDTISYKILKLAKPFNCVIRVKKSILDYVETEDHSAFYEWDKARKEQAKKAKIKMVKKRKQNKERREHLEQRINNGEEIRYEPPVKLTIGERYKITTKNNDPDAVGTIYRVKVIEEYPRLYYCKDNKGCGVCINKNNLFMDSTIVEVLK